MQDEDRMSSAEKDLVGGEVMESLGEPADATEEIEQPAERSKDDPLYVQKRLKRQERQHAKELREMQARIDLLSQKFESPGRESGRDLYDAGGEDTLQQGNMNDAIGRAVEAAMQAQQMQSRKADEAQKYAHVQKQYQSLSDHLDNLSDQYDDFDDVVRGRDAPFTDSMRDAALMLPMNGQGSAGETLYKLGKNRSELERIAKLHPLDQAKEMIKLSMSLMSGGQSDKNNQSPRTLGQIKSQPVSSSHDVNESTPISELRRRMKAGWKR